MILENKQPHSNPVLHKASHYPTTDPWIKPKNHIFNTPGHGHRTVGHSHSNYNHSSIDGPTVRKSVAGHEISSGHHYGPTVAHQHRRVLGSHQVGTENPRKSFSHSQSSTQVQHVGSRGHGIGTGTAHRVVMDTPERRLVSESSHQRGIVRKYKKNPDGSTTLISDSTCLDSQLNNNAYETPKRTPIHTSHTDSRRKVDSFEPSSDCLGNLGAPKIHTRVIRKDANGQILSDSGAGNPNVRLSQGSNVPRRISAHESSPQDRTIGRDIPL